MPEISTLFILSAVAGLLGLDATAAFQVMVSRPLVVGGVAGSLLGDTALGLTVGSLVELLWMGGVPVGSLVPPDGTQAGVFAAAVAILLKDASLFPGAGEAAASLGVLAAVPVGIVAARGEIIQRHLNDRLSRRAEQYADEGRLDQLGSILMTALALAWFRGALVCGLCLLVGLPSLHWILANLPADGIQALHWCFWLFWLLGLAVAADHFWERRGLKYAALALVLMAVLGAQLKLGQLALVLTAAALAHAVGLWRWLGARKGEAA